jgi:prepilin-type N-terminal cleavage/methylation domain-containing protein
VCKGTSAGFTLIEVMITVTILAVGLIGVNRAYVSIVNALEVADYTIEMVSLLGERMFEVERRAIEEDNLLPGARNGRFTGEYVDFKWKEEIGEVDSSLEEDEETEESEDAAKDLIMYLKKAKITVSNENVTPVRKFTLVGYTEGYGERKE